MVCAQAQNLTVQLRCTEFTSARRSAWNCWPMASRRWPSSSPAS